MAIADTINSMKTNITNAYNAIQTKGGTVPTNKNLANLSTAINSIPAGGGIEDVATVAALKAKVTAENVGKFYKYTGTSSGGFEKNELYCVVENSGGGYDVLGLGKVTYNTTKYTVTYNYTACGDDAGTPIRNMPLGDDYEALNNIYPKAIHDPDINPTIIFIDADDQVLIKRYAETRRLHPLSLKNLSLNEAIAKEAEVLKVISSIADLRIDTTNLSIHELCQQVITCVQGKPHKKIVIIFESFGYKDGITKDADFVFDARFLPNPYWDKSIRQYCGLDEPIKKFFSKYPEVENYIDKIDDLLFGILKAIEQSDRSYLTVAIGCTGGYHRSVYIAQSLADKFQQRGICVKVRHRSLIKSRQNSQKS